MRSISTVFYLLICSFCFVVYIANAQVEPQESENIDGMWDEWKMKAEKGVEDPLIEWHYYWKDGLHIDSTEKKLEFKLNGRVMVDGATSVPMMRYKRPFLIFRAAMETFVTCE